MSYNDRVEVEKLNKSILRKEAITSSEPSDEMSAKKLFFNRMIRNVMNNEFNAEENKVHDIFHYFDESPNLNSIEGKIFPEFIHKGIADSISIIDNNIGSVWTVDNVDFSIRHIFWINPQQCVTSRIPMQLLFGDTDGFKVDSSLLNNFYTTDYFFCINSVNHNENNDNAIADILLVKVQDVLKYLEVMSGMSANDFVNTVYTLSDNYNDVVNGETYSADDDMVYLCKGAYISFERGEKAYLMNLNLSAYIAKQLPNTRHFRWSGARGLVEISDKLYRPELNKNNDDDKPVIIELA